MVQRELVTLARSGDRESFSALAALTGSIDRHRLRRRSRIMLQPDDSGTCSTDGSGAFT